MGQLPAVPDSMRHDPAGRGIEGGIVARKKRRWPGFLSILLAGLLLFLACRGVDWSRMGTLLRNCRFNLLTAAVLIATLAYILRALRWRVLLSCGASVPAATVFWANSVGYLGNNFLPARAGEVVRAVLISSRAGLSPTFALTTALAERVTDAVVLVAFSSLTLAGMVTSSGGLQRASPLMAFVGTSGLVLLVVFPWLAGAVVRRLDSLRMPGAWKDRLTSIVTQAARGVGALHSPGRLFAFLAFTGFIWCLDVAGTVTVAYSLGLSVPPKVALLLVTSLGLSSAVPSTPGYVGVHQFVAVSVLGPFGFSRADALALILLIQALTYVVVIFWGGVGLWRFGVFSWSSLHEILGKVTDSGNQREMTGTRR